MLGSKIETLLAVAEFQNFTKAAASLSLTQPAVSHHINQLEEELGVTLFIRGKGSLMLTPEGEIVLKYARRIKALYGKMETEIDNSRKQLTKVRIGITHTSESNLITEVLARCSNADNNFSITIITDTINNLYDMLENYELDLAIVDGAYGDPRFFSMLLDTDYLTCVMSVDNPLARKGAVTLAELRRQKMILRTPASATRTLFESALESNGESIQSFDVTLEVDNIATIKDLIRKDLGVSILPRSACLDELQKGKIAAVPVENLSMVRETRIVYNKDFTHTDMLNEIIKTYGSTVMN